MTTKICDRCGANVSDLQKTLAEYLGKEICKSCMDGAEAIMRKMNTEHIQRRDDAVRDYLNDAYILKPTVRKKWYQL